MLSKVLFCFLVLCIVHCEEAEVAEAASKKSTFYFKNGYDPLLNEMSSPNGSIKTQLTNYEIEKANMEDNARILSEVSKPVPQTAPSSGVSASQSGSIDIQKGSGEINAGSIVNEKGTVSTEKGTSSVEKGTSSVVSGTSTAEKGTTSTEKGTSSVTRGTAVVSDGRSKPLQSGKVDVRSQLSQRMKEIRAIKDSEPQQFKNTVYENLENVIRQQSNSFGAENSPIRSSPNDDIFYNKLVSALKQRASNDNGNISA